MAGYAKLFGSILDSTVWDTPPAITKVWITMIAMADRDGLVEASVPGLASRARVQRADAEAALAMFSSPDPDSRTKDYDGRRIEEVDGGWQLLNYEKYRDRGSRDEKRAKDTARQQRRRERDDPADGQQTIGIIDSSRSVTLCHASSPLRSGSGSDPTPEPDSSEPVSPTVTEPPVVVFPVLSRGVRPKEWLLTRPMIQELEGAYPSVRVETESRRALLWLKANPKKQKTYRGMAAFLNGWMGRVQDRGGGGNGPAAAFQPKPYPQYRQPPELPTKIDLSR